MAPVSTHCTLFDPISAMGASASHCFQRPGSFRTGRSITAKRRVLARVVVSALVLFFVLPFAFADGGDALDQHLASLEEHPFVTEALFKNGLKILINENRAYPVVAIGAVVPDCTAVFPEAETGPEGLLSAMFFRREKSEEEGTVERNAHLIGARLSATFDYGSCHFEIEAPAPQWKRALRLHSQAVLDPAYDPVQLERAIAQLEAKAAYDLESPSVSSLAGILDLAFSPASGDPNPAFPADEGLKAASADTLAKRHKEMFSAGGMMLVISGDINAIEVLREAAVLYGGVAPGVPDRRVGFKDGKQGAFRYRRSAWSVGRPRILFGFHVPGAESPDFAAVEILNAVVGLGRGSVLQSRTRGRKKLILRGTTELISGPRSGYWIIDTIVPFENIDRYEIDLLVELELLKRRVLAEPDLERARAQLERSYREEIQTVSGRVRALAQFEKRGDWKGIDRRISEIRSVSPADLRRVAEKYFRMENCSLFEYLPASVPAGNRTLESVRNTLEALLNPATSQELASRDREVSFPAVIPDRDDEYRYSSIQHPFRPASVLRGPEMYIREDHTTPLIHMGVFYPGGRLDESEKDSGITSLMVPLMLEGTDGKETLQFYRQLEIYGGRIEPVVTDDYMGFYFSIPSKNFGPGFDILTDILKSPEFDPETVEPYKEILAEKRSQQGTDRATVSSAIRRKLFQSFSYGLDPLGTPEAVSRMTPDSLRAWYDRHVRNKTPLVIIIGDTEGTSLASYFVQNFSGSRFQQAELAEEFPPPLEAGAFLEDTWERNRGIAAIGFQAPPVGDRDLYAALALRNCLLLDMEKLREEKSWVSAGVFYEPKLRGGILAAYAIVDSGGEEQALETIESRIYGSLARSFEFIEYRSALNMAQGDFWRGQENPIAQILSVAGSVFGGEGIEGYSGFIDRMGAVREEDVRDAAERVIDRERGVRMRIRGRSAAEGRDTRETRAP